MKLWGRKKAKEGPFYSFPNTHPVQTQDRRYKRLSDLLSAPAFLLKNLCLQCQTPKDCFGDCCSSCYDKEKTKSSASLGQGLEFDTKSALSFVAREWWGWWRLLRGRGWGWWRRWWIESRVTMFSVSIAWFRHTDQCNT